MSVNRASNATGAGLAALVLCLVGHQAKGDSLTVTLEKDAFALYEMITVRVTLRLEEPFSASMEDPYEASQQLARLRRRLYIELRAPNGEPLTEGLLFGVAFVPTDEPAQEFRTMGWGFLGEADRKGDDFEHWKRPGSHVLVVCDKENKLESKRIPVSLRMPERTQLEAARIFASGGVDAISLVGEGKHWQRETLELFSRLASDYPETIHGKYALASLALVNWQGTFRQHSNKGASEVWTPVAEELSKASTLFAGAHPLRERVLFRLAQAQAFAGNPSGARRTAELLSVEFMDGQFGRKAEDMVAELEE